MDTLRGKSVCEVLLSVWWISWFGILGGFLYVGAVEYKRQMSHSGAAPGMCLALLIIITLSWAAFYAADSKVKNRESVAVNLLTTMGTILAAFTALGIYFFIAVAPLIH